MRDVKELVPDLTLENRLLNPMPDISNSDAPPALGRRHRSEMESVLSLVLL